MFVKPNIYINIQMNIHINIHINTHKTTHINIHRNIHRNISQQNPLLFLGCFVKQVASSNTNCYQEVKIQIIGGKVCLRCKGKTLLSKVC